ncbi:MAG: hypothetical protein GY705_16745 [Bacteroidetes bacterium]|nr:hypothetical protein [Bacteroidota bacterium]
MNNELLEEINLEPTAGSTYSFGWNIMKTHFLELLLVVVIVFAVQIPLGLLRQDDAGIFSNVIGAIYSVLIGGPIGYGVAYVFLKVIRGQEFDINDIFSVFKENYMNVVLAYLLSTAIIIIGFILLIIPGIILACRLAFVPYLVMDGKLEPVEAVKKSWEMTEPHAWTIFLMGLTAIPICLAGLVLLGVGLIPAIMWIEATFAAMYFVVSEQEEKKGFV